MERGGHGFSHLHRAGRVQKDPHSQQLGAGGLGGSEEGAGRKRMAPLGQSSCTQMLPRGSCSRRGRLWGEWRRI